MTREEAKKIAEAMMAYAEGKNIEFSRWGAEDWQPCDNPSFQFGSYQYRVQPDSGYRPFENVDECFEEMKKHEPFGWIKNKALGYNMNICTVDTRGIGFGSTCQYSYREIFDKFTFADGSLFGVKRKWVWMYKENQVKSSTSEV